MVRKNLQRPRLLADRLRAAEAGWLHCQQRRRRLLAEAIHPPGCVRDGAAAGRSQSVRHARVMILPGATPQERRAGRRSLGGDARKARRDRLFDRIDAVLDGCAGQ